MTSKKTDWFEVVVRYDKTMEDGLQKKVSEQYAVEALSFGEAEEKIVKEMSSCVSNGLEVKKINPAPYKEVFFSDKSVDDRYYKVVLTFITADERTGKEKKTNITYLVQACSLEKAKRNTEEVMTGSAMDYVFKSVAESKNVDVFKHDA